MWHTSGSAPFGGAGTPVCVDLTTAGASFAGWYALMTIGFAGSRCVDERRRRRLAQEADQETQPERRSAPRAPTARPVETASVPEPFVPQSPIESLIRPEPWVKALWSVLAVAAWVGLLVLGGWIDRARPALAEAFGLQGGLLPRAVRAACLLMAAQLSYIVLWHRSRCRKDFSGRYKVWFWVVPACLVFALCAATDAHWHAGRAVRDRWPLDVRNMDALAWLIPAGIVVLALTRLLQIEMRGSRISIGALWLSTLAASVVAGLTLAGHLLTAPATIPMLSAVAANLWPFALFLSLWHYAWRVIHVTAEAADARLPRAAPPRTAGPWTALRRWWAARAVARGERRTARAQARAKEAAAAETRDSSAASDTAPRTRAAADRKPTRSAEVPPPAAPPPPKPAPRPEERRVIPAFDVAPRSAPAAAAKPAVPSPAPERAAPATMRIDPPRAADPDSGETEDDDDQDAASTSGLSKKERRRLRKLQRQQQRDGQF